MQPLIFIVYDGINHSIFPGQVIAPLLKCLKHNEAQHIYVVSFEKGSVPDKLLNHYQAVHPRLHIIIFKRLPFVGFLSLYPAIVQFKRFLKTFSAYSIKARGAFAGLVALRSYVPERCESLTVQARGLLAAEYSCSYESEKNIIKRLIHQWRAKKLWQVEQFVYAHPVVQIESITHAMQKYLSQTFDAQESTMFIAHEDIPDPLPSKQRKTWRSETRNQLNIASDAHVYCYSGSIKAWHCPDQVIAFFKQRLIEQSNSFLLVLTTDKKEYEAALVRSGLEQCNFCVLTVAHQDIYRYLAACDTGLVFNKKHILSWVARPVKALEYRSVGLNIVHPGTVAWLNDLYPSRTTYP